MSRCIKVITCEECDHLVRWRSGESAEKYGACYECSIHIIECPTPSDYCSHARAIKKCPRCAKRFDEYPKFCPDCGYDLGGIDHE